MRRIGCLGIIVLVVTGVLFYHFRKDILIAPLEGYTIEDKVYLSKLEVRFVRSTIVILKDAPYLEGNIKTQLDEFFWRHMSRDTLQAYDTFFVQYYRERKFLNEKFKEGNEYDSCYFLFDDNIMDWRKHYEDRLGNIRFRVEDDGSVSYDMTIFSSGYGFRMAVDILQEKRYAKKYSSVKEAYEKKRRELGL